MDNTKQWIQDCYNFRNKVLKKHDTPYAVLRCGHVTFTGEASDVVKRKATHYRMTCLTEDNWKIATDRPMPAGYQYAWVPEGLDVSSIKSFEVAPPRTNYSRLTASIYSADYAPAWEYQFRGWLRQHAISSLPPVLYKDTTIDVLLQSDDPVATFNIPPRYNLSTIRADFVSHTITLVDSLNAAWFQNMPYILTGAVITVFAIKSRVHSQPVPTYTEKEALHKLLQSYIRDLLLSLTYFTSVHNAYISAAAILQHMELTDSQRDTLRAELASVQQARKDEQVLQERAELLKAFAMQLDKFHDSSVKDYAKDGLTAFSAYVSQHP